MQAFLSWPGWTGVSGIAQVVALGTFAVAAWRYILQRRQFPAVYITWEAIATSTRSDGNRYHLVEFHNIGRAPAVILSMFLSNSRAELDDDYRAPETLAPGDSFQLLISAHKIDDAWFRLTWQTLSDRRRVHVEWGAILPGGALGMRYREEHEAWYKQSLPVRFVLRLRGTEVGPGAAPHATVARATRFKKRLQRVLTPADGTGPWFSAKPGGTAYELPYVEP